MCGAFPDAEVTGHMPLVDLMTCDHKNRHMPAAAVIGGALVSDWPPQAAT